MRITLTKLPTLTRAAHCRARRVVAIVLIALVAPSLVAITTALLSVPAMAEAAVPATPPRMTEPTLARIQRTGVVLVGVREASVPFSYQDAQKQPIGYSVDLCMRVVDALRAELKLPKLQHRFVTLASADRIPALLEGRVDMECGSTTNTVERQKQVDFSYGIFVTGARVMARKSDGVMELRDLRGKTVSVTKGTTGERLVRAVNDAERYGMTILSNDTNDASFQTVETKRASAFITDDILLYGLISRSPNKDAFEVVGKYISIEPYAIMLRKNDDPFKTIVNRTLGRTFESGDIYRIYAKWFENKERNIPISRFFQEMILLPSNAAAYP